jgi:signal peptidase II
LKSNYLPFIGLALLVVLIDQVSKRLAIAHIPPHQILTVIPGFFNIMLVENRGMAFGIFNQTHSGVSYFFLLATTIAAIGVILLFFFLVKKSQLWLSIGLALILGGAIGNLIDRVHLGYVIDFLDFYLSGYHWPAFNMADSAVTVGTLWLLLNIVTGKKL